MHGVLRPIVWLYNSLPRNVCGASKVELPAKVKAIVEAAAAAGFIIEQKKQQAMLWGVSQDGHQYKVGGWNTRNKHWYVSNLLAPNDQSELMEGHGFRWMEKSAGRHCWWQIDGAENTDAFRAVVAKLTGTPF